MTAQAEFDQKYVSSTELCRTMEVSREALRVARERGTLPEPVRVMRPGGGVQVMLWERALLEPYLVSWRAERQAAPR